MEFWDQFPNGEVLKDRFTDIRTETIPDVNAHMHTPYSFSAFISVDQAVKLAVEQNVGIIGINDFYTVSGYVSWAEACMRHKAFPLFNIEFIGLSKINQEKNIRINDPNNPGRIYISGKGLSFPFKLKEPWKSHLERLQSDSNNHVRLICKKLNEHLSDRGIDIRLDYDSIVQTHTKGIIRERHLAKVLREKVLESAKTDAKIRLLLSEIYGNSSVQVQISDHAALENEIRNNLLKSGGHAFVPENPDSFLSVESIREIILHGGGIPTYPVLADDKNGDFTEFEQNKYRLAEELKRYGIFSVEFISTRNSPEVLEDYATWFSDNGFVVTFGSEHNTPELSPILLYTSDSAPLSAKMREINYYGACLIAAHQFLVSKVGTGYLNKQGIPLTEKGKEYRSLGNSLIQYFFLK